MTDQAPGPLRTPSHADTPPTDPAIEIPGSSLKKWHLRRQRYPHRICADLGDRDYRRLRARMQQHRLNFRQWLLHQIEHDVPPEWRSEARYGIRRLIPLPEAQTAYELAMKEAEQLQTIAKALPKEAWEARRDLNQRAGYYLDRAAWAYDIIDGYAHLPARPHPDVPPPPGAERDEIGDTGQDL